MCGIIGYTGPLPANGILLDGLKRLEYRGYDSAGMAVMDGSRMKVVKRAGRVGLLEDLVGGLMGHVGIAHTRWATHGGVTDANAHPHTSCDGMIAIVHNGILENSEELREELIGRGHRFTSETDSEIIAHVLEEELKGVEKEELVAALLRTVRRLEGSFAFLAISPLLGDVILAARKDSPMVVGVLPDAKIPASDVLSFLKWTDDAYFMENESVALMTPVDIEAWLFDGTPLDVRPVKVAVEVKGEYGGGDVHHTLKEIREQPSAVRRALEQDGELLSELAGLMREADRVYAVGAGTSYHAALVARYMFAGIAGLDVQPVLASEHRLFSGWIGDGSLVMAISQSGETADVLEAVRVAKARGAKIVAIVNMPRSSLERMSHASVNIRAGPEVGVAATKSFTAQLAVLAALAYHVAGRPIDLDGERVGSLIEDVLAQEGSIERMVEGIKDGRDVYLVGRGMHYPIALEGALKMKELAYIHAEGMAAGELKHGTLALIEGGTPVILLNPSDDTYRETLSNGEEMKARGAFIMGISDRSSDLYDVHIELPRTRGYETPMVEVVPLQLMAYYTALLRGAEIDKPRNLAKSVTVK